MMRPGQRRLENFVNLSPTVGFHQRSLQKSFGKVML
jgi:hypothetical protein